jgi:hypothetical protein
VGGDQQSWPFVVPLPSRANPRVVMLGNGGHARASFLPLTDNAILTEVIPPSFVSSGSHGNKSFDAYVEYYLQAIIHDKKQDVATSSLRVVRPAKGNISDFMLRNLTFPGIVRTPRLVPGLEDTKVSLLDKTRALFHSKKIAAFGFELVVSQPQYIQLDNPTPIPFKLRIAPIQGRTSESIRDVPQRATLVSLKLRLVCRTDVLAPGTKNPHTTYDTTKVILGPVFKPDAEHPNRIPASGSPGEFLDFGGTNRLRLASTGFFKTTRYMYPVPLSALTPSFTTYCCWLRHSLHWELKIECAGETKKFKDSRDVRLLAPAFDETRRPASLPAASTAAVASSSRAVPVPVPEDKPPGYEGDGKIPPPEKSRGAIPTYEEASKSAPPYEG